MVFYCCLSCDFPIKISCARKRSKWHERTLHLTCNVSALADVSSMDSESELISLITQLLFVHMELNSEESEFTSLRNQIISLMSSMDLNSQPKPVTEFMSLITQTISVFNSIDLNCLPEPLSKLILLLYANYMDSDSSWEKLKFIFKSLFHNILTLEPEPDLISLIHRIFSVVISMNSKSRMFFSLYPQKRVTLEHGKFHVTEKVYWSGNGKWECFPGKWLEFKYLGDDITYFRCRGCNGDNHEEYKNAIVEIQHYLHRNHSLRLVMLDENSRTRKCYCCDDNIQGLFFWCMPCDFAMNNACLKKPLVFSIDHPKWHEHTLALFPRQAFLTCNLCALADERSPIYMCPSCDFVLHLKCINLPRVIRISRHYHRISFTFSFNQGDLSCGVCRRIIDNKYGGYSCIKEGCSYVVHSRCATQQNVWDGKELEGEPEEIEEEEVEPFVRISDGIIQHFSHQLHHHHLRLDENTCRDYDENKVCQACITPIYFGNFYSCMQCNFILHEECANLSRKIYHPIHPHLLSLGYGNAMVKYTYENKCTACPQLCVVGFFYKCNKDGCRFKLHVQCATISEPLVHESHMHPLFLTSKPEEERRICLVCKGPQRVLTKETFNCIEECDFALCFGCATLPQMVRYKHDKHILTLSYGEETSAMTYWCEVCEGKVNPKQRFYVCDEYCCLTLHIECLLGRDLYMNPGSSWVHYDDKVPVLPNNHHMTRPICSQCEQRCSQKIFFQLFGLIYCSVFCLRKL
ncbi:Protein VACUOLELESS GAMETOPHYTES [Cardamine amara subsp. amara]|uniref:Protein VACUOLELESS GAMETOPHYTES n=1 Tax=Cardamine amara subsp. amara TaxID=228776 RepID=A0ABD0ZBK8_CARAN